MVASSSRPKTGPSLSRLTDIAGYRDRDEVAPPHASSSASRSEGGIHEPAEFGIGRIGRRDDPGLASAFLREAGGARVRNPDLHRPQSGGSKGLPARADALADG